MANMGVLSLVEPSITLGVRREKDAMHTATELDPRTIDLLFLEAATPGGFTDEPVADAQIVGAYEHARMAPTAFNGQPMRLVMVNSADKRSELVPLVNEGNRARVASAPQVAIIAADTNFHLRFDHLNPRMADNPLFADDARRVAMAKSQTWLQTGYLILALRMQGLAVGPMTGFNAQAVTETLLSGTSLEALSLLTIGHADLEAARPRGGRLQADEAITWL